MKALSVNDAWHLVLVKDSSRILRSHELVSCTQPIQAANIFTIFDGYLAVSHYYHSKSYLWTSLG